MTRRQGTPGTYAAYLQSDTWKRIRSIVLKRDKHKCRACGVTAKVVHHAQYPEILGEEKTEWLFSLCTQCHNLIHGIKGVSLEEATAVVLAGAPIPVRRKGGKRRKKRRAKWVTPAHIKSTKQKTIALAEENSRLHELQVRNREAQRRRRQTRYQRLDLSDLLDR